MSQEDAARGPASSPSRSRRRCNAPSSTTRCPSSSRARCPDVRDGLKPVHRRILWSMYEQGLRPDRPHRKSANVGRRRDGQVPPARRRADLRRARSAWRRTSRCAYPLVDGHGNFGSVDRRPAGGRCATPRRGSRRSRWSCSATSTRTPSTSSRTTTATTQRAGRAPGALPEPARERLGGGIAVGMATNIPPHNLGEVIDAIVHLIDHPESTPEDLMSSSRAPTSRPAGSIMGRDGHPGRVRDRPRLDQDARGRRRSRRAATAGRASSSPSCRTR